jgi:hypothetical protein
LKVEVNVGNYNGDIALHLTAAEVHDVVITLIIFDIRRLSASSL